MLFVPLPVVLELIRVLESVYAIERKELLDALSALLLMPILQFEHCSTVSGPHRKTDMISPICSLRILPPCRGVKPLLLLTGKRQSIRSLFRQNKECLFSCRYLL